MAAADNAPTEGGDTLNILLQEDLIIRGGAQLWLMNCGSRLAGVGHTVTFLLPADSLIREDCEGLSGNITVVTYDKEKIAEVPEDFREQFTGLLAAADVCVTLVRQKRGSFQNVGFMANCIETAGLKTQLIAKTGTPDPSYDFSFYGGPLLDAGQCSVITIAEYTKQFIVDNMGVKAEYITNVYNGTDTERFKRTEEMATECLVRYPLVEGAFVVGCIGSFEQRKGQSVLLEAAKMLVEDGRLPSIHLLMVGEGPDKEMLLGKIEEFGLTAHASIFDFTKQPFYVFERCDVVALPSYKEGLPNVLLEALAMETPCVSSRIMGCPEVVIDGVTGYNFEMGNAQELADALVRIFQLSPEEKLTMAAKGKEIVFAEHDKVKQFEKILAIIQEKARLARA